MRAGCATPNHEVAGSNPIGSKVLLIRGFFAFYTSSFFAVFSQVSAKRSFACVNQSTKREKIFIVIFFHFTDIIFSVKIISKSFVFSG